jgi:hypothetical protein
MSFWNGNKWVAQAPPPAAVAAAKPESRAKRIAAAALEASLITALTFGLIAGSAFAAKGGGGSKPSGGHGGHSGGSGTLTATLTVAPNPTPAYSDFQYSGCGYTPNAGVQFNLYAPGVTHIWAQTADSGGCITGFSWASAPGSARLDALAGSTTLVASTTFTIQ